MPTRRAGGAWLMLIPLYVLQGLGRGIFGKKFAIPPSLTPFRQSVASVRCTCTCTGLILYMLTRVYSTLRCAQTSILRTPTVRPHLRTAMYRQLPTHALRCGAGEQSRPTRPSSPISARRPAPRYVCRELFSAVGLHCRATLSG
jgi:hypothetical protein